MSNPHHFINGIGPFGYPYNMMPMTYNQNILINPMNTFQFSPYPNSLTYTYVMPH